MADVSTITGTVLLDGSPAAALMRLYLADTGELIEEINSDEVTGDYTFGAGAVQLSAQPHYVVCIYGDGVRPLAHGPVTPAVTSAPVPTFDFEDAFDGASLDVAKWVSAVKGASTVQVSGGHLELILPSAAVANARATSIIAIATTGVVTIEVDWLPAGLGGNGYGTPYMALVTGTPSRDANYQFPLSVPMLKLGGQADTVSRSVLAAGISGGTQAITGGSYTPATALPYEVEYHFKWVIDWSAATMSLYLDDVLVIDAATFTYTPSGDHFIELASCDYNTNTNRTERFRNLTVLEA
jgi:hypothetical protein